jgi:hypothetical protein
VHFPFIGVILSVGVLPKLPHNERVNLLPLAVMPAILGR